MTTDSIETWRRERYNATAMHIERIHSDLMVLRIRPDFPRPKYVAGQYCALGLGNWEARVAGCQVESLRSEDAAKIVRRSYSISSSILDARDNLRDMTQDDWLEFYIVLVRENLDGRIPALTPRLFELNEGDRLIMGEKIVGHFTAECVGPSDNVVLLSTGTGEAPHNAIVWELLRRGHRGRILNACCVRYGKDLGYTPLHRKVMERHENYRYLGLTTREIGIRKIYLQDLLTSGELELNLGAELEPQNTHVYLCGNPMMIGAPTKDKATGLRSYPPGVGMIELLEQRGFVVDQPAAKIKGNIHFEEYW